MRKGDGIQLLLDAISLLPYTSEQQPNVWGELKY